MKHDKVDGELPVQLASNDNSEGTGTLHVEQNNDWLAELELEMEAMEKKWPGAGNLY
ncbi:hypothetical protein [Pantoea sp. Morm]|uniref:hypothetical protein n=1 Tax=Pantoea sp. Morm TaxID=2601250 RepID=UPI0031FC7D70